jgi:hypothetical protein
MSSTDSACVASDEKCFSAAAVARAGAAGPSIENSPPRRWMRVSNACAICRMFWSSGPHRLASR